MTRTRRRRLALVVLLAAGATACGGSTSTATHELGAIEVPATIKVTSPAFADNGTIPSANTCSGPGLPIPISWTAVPTVAKSVAVVVDDPDAPGGDFLHWLVVGLPPRPGSVPTRESNVNELDNTGGTHGWTPPCPTAGTTHHYHFTVYALNDYICADDDDATNGPTCSPPASDDALAQIRGDAIAKGVLVGTYRR